MYRSTGTGDLGGSRQVHRHVAGSLSLKSRKNEKSGFFEKPDFPVRIWIRWYRNIRGGDPEVPRGRRSQKKAEKKFPKNPDFPDPDFRICFHAVAIGAPRATCSQNFRPLAVLEAEMLRSLTIIKYRIPT